MFRALAIALVVISGCGKSASNQDKVNNTTASKDETIAVPGPGPETVKAPDQTTTTSAPPGAPNPAFFLKPEEGTLTVDKAEGKAGAESTATIKIAPATNYHVATDFPIKLTLEPTAGITLPKTELTAGGRNKEQGDAQALSEKGLAFAVKATAEKAGSYEIKGTLKFGICEKDSCHPKKQPITITVAAN